MSVPFENRLTIATPEGVEVELTLADVGSRFMAGMLDFALQIAVIVALGMILQPDGGASAAVFSSVAFAIIFFYDVLFEVLGGGRTIGKRAAGLRVVRSGGRPINLTRSALRNILRIIDILPGFYGVGMAVIFATPHNQRVGDLAAGTLVIRDRFGDHGDPPPRPPSLPPAAAERAATWDVTAVSGDDVATVHAFLARRGQLREEARRSIAGELASRLRPRVGGAPDDLDDEAFLESLAAAKASRA
jgi:uncharacterized RDD family membrane protein YckC